MKNHKSQSFFRVLVIQTSFLNMVNHSQTSFFPNRFGTLTQTNQISVTGYAQVGRANRVDPFLYYVIRSIKSANKDQSQEAGSKKDA